VKELSLNILDIAQNSVKAGATLIEITLEETAARLDITVRDNGCGMSPELLEKVKDPFITTRTTRSVGLGIPFFALAAEQTGGSLNIVSSQVENHGTALSARFNKNHIDFTPLGDIVSTIITLVQGNPDINIEFKHTITGENPRQAEFSSSAIKAVLGEVSLSEPEVLKWIREYLTGQYAQNG
jgi:K+-sensing histidine kinase KdpD